ncbi:MAG: hypothetical protein WCY32_08015 [Burkholderiaceae bacterium]
MAGRVLAFEDFTPGHTFPTTHYRISADDNRAFRQTIPFEAFRDDSERPLPAPVEAQAAAIHPTLVGSFQPQHAVFGWPAGVIHAREKVQTFLPVVPDEMLASTVSVLDCSERKGRKFVVLKIQIDKVDAGQTALIVERTLVWPY